MLEENKEIKYRCPNCGKQIRAIQREDGTILASCPICKSNIVCKRKIFNKIEKTKCIITKSLI